MPNILFQPFRVLMPISYAFTKTGGNEVAPFKLFAFFFNQGAFSKFIFRVLGMFVNKTIMLLIYDLSGPRD